MNLRARRSILPLNRTASGRSVRPPRTGRRLSRASDALLSRAGINSFAATHKEPKRYRCDEV
jgi:hypothetical protein